MEIFGYSDVGDFMMVTDLRLWGHNHYVGHFLIMMVIFNVHV